MTGEAGEESTRDSVSGRRRRRGRRGRGVGEEKEGAGPGDVREGGIFCSHAARRAQRRSSRPMVAEAAVDDLLGSREL